MTKKLNFLKLPTKFSGGSDKTTEEIKDCKECLQKCELMGLDASKTCPECEENEEDSLILAFDYVDCTDIRTFNKNLDEDTVIVEFYNGVRVKYELTIDEFLIKFTKFANIS